jgi:gluconolactonase
MKVNLAMLTRIGLGVWLAAFLTAPVAWAQDAANDLVGSFLGSVQRLDPALDELLEPGAKIEVLGQGYAWSEGPIWMAKENRLLFSDIPPNRIMQWRAGQGVTLYQKGVGFSGQPSAGGREPGTNGLMLSPDGHLYACCHGDRVIKRRKADETWEVVVDNFDGKKFNSPNDLTFHQNGDLYFTDPPYGLVGGPDDPSRELDFCGVYRWDGQKVHLLTKELNRPNGIAFSPDYRTLYVAQSDGAAPTWTAFPVQADGSIGPGHVLMSAKDFYGKDPGSPDGLKVDQQGNLWATGPGGVWIISPEGKVLGKIMTGRPTANCGFGGPDGSWLFMTANELLLRIPTKTRGLPQQLGD